MTPMFCFQAFLPRYFTLVFLFVVRQCVCVHSQEKWHQSDRLTEQRRMNRGQQTNCVWLKKQANFRYPVSVCCFCNSSAITLWRQNMLTLYILGSDAERKIFCGFFFFFFPNQFWCMSQSQLKVLPFSRCVSEMRSQSGFLTVFTKHVGGALCVFISHATCCSFWIGVLNSRSGVQWVGLTHTSQMFSPHTIYDGPARV